MLARLKGTKQQEPTAYARETARVERLAVDAVLAAEKALGREATEMPHNNPGYDVFSKDPTSNECFFIEVKGRVAGAPIFTVTRNEILTALNKPDQYILALVEIAEDDSAEVRYLGQPFAGKEEAFFDLTTANYDWPKLWGRGSKPNSNLKPHKAVKVVVQ